VPITTTWYDDDHRAVYQKFEGQWTWDDFARELTALNEFSSSVPYNLVVFEDLSQANTIPGGNGIAQGRMIMKLIPNTVTVVFVIQSRFQEAMVATVINLFPNWRNRVKFAKTLDEGRALVARLVAQNAEQSTVT
jgi:hypothetical protein